MQLVIGNKNYSSWSLRPWLLLRHFGIDFEEIPIALFTPGYRDQLRRYSPHGKVPVLIDGELTVWESLAIAEYINEQYLQGRALPAGREARALCRAYCHEMHAGFPALREQLPMNCRARRTLQFGEEVQKECRRIETLWRNGRRRFVGMGDYLFGRFSLADCMYAPVALRFRTYGIVPSEEAGDYCEFLLENAALRQWCADAEQESTVIAAAEIGQD